MAVTLRTNKGSALTFAEMDANFSSFMTLSSSGASRELLGISAPFKSFLIDHPTKEGMKLQYGSLESPYHGVRLTGKNITTNGVCRVQLPDYIHGLCKAEDANIQLTNIKHGKTLYVETVNVEKDYFVVMCEEPGDFEFFWSFTGVRKDIPDMLVEFVMPAKEAKTSDKK